MIAHRTYPGDQPMGHGRHHHRWDEHDPRLDGPRRRHHREGRPDRGFGPGPGFGPGFGPGRLLFMGRRRPTRRGEIRAAILALLAESPMHGYQIITELSERSGGEWRPSAGSVYPTLQQLTDEGLVRDVEQDGRRVYQLTDAGRAAAAELGGQTPPWQATSDDGQPDLRRVLSQVAAATVQIGRDGSPAMGAKAYELLAETRRGLYRLLAEDEPVASAD